MYCPNCGKECEVDFKIGGSSCKFCGLVYKVHFERHLSEKERRGE